MAPGASADSNSSLDQLEEKARDITNAAVAQGKKDVEDTKQAAGAHLEAAAAYIQETQEKVVAAFNALTWVSLGYHLCSSFGGSTVRAKSKDSDEETHTSDSAEGKKTG
jgi:hypothetical protein